VSWWVPDDRSTSGAAQARIEIGPHVDRQRVVRLSAGDRLGAQQQHRSVMSARSSSMPSWRKVQVSSRCRRVHHPEEGLGQLGYDPEQLADRAGLVDQRLHRAGGGVERLPGLDRELLLAAPGVLAARCRQLMTEESVAGSAM